MGKPETSKAVQKKIVAMYLKTGKMVDTARACGVSWPTLYRVLYAHGVERGYGRKKHLERTRAIKAENEAEIARLHHAGTTAAELAKRFACSEWAIAKVIKKAGLRPHRRGGKRRILSEEDIAEAIRLYEEGQSCVKVAAVLGCNQTTVGNVLKERGVKLRTLMACGPDHGTWNGGRTRTGEGYWRVALDLNDPLAAMRNRSGYVLEHRLVMARSLGRALSKHETVHHINGDRTDNRPENLQLRQGRHGKGVRHVCADCGSHNVIASPLHQDKP